jgi:hypothetical protein
VRIADPVPARAGESGVRLVLSPARTISGRVIDETGGDPDPLKVEAWPVDGSSEFVVRGDVRRDGFFETGAIGGGRYRIVVRADGEDARVGVSAPIEAGTRDVRIPVRAGETIAGVVRDAAGEPVEGARVALRGSFTYRHVLTPHEGAFAFRGLPPGRYRLRASVDGPPAATVEREVEAGGPDVILVLGGD